MTIGERIKQARKEAGLTQKKLAEKIGIAETTIRRYESNERQPRIEQLYKISETIGVPINSLVGINESTNSTDAIHQLAIEKYGIDHEVDILLEEMAELQNELLKSRRGRTCEDAIRSEIADVYIGLHNIMAFYGDCVDEITYKKNRLKRKIELDDENY